MEDFKFIEKVSETPLDEKTGLIFNGENIENKAENTYSAETIDKLVEEYSGVEEGTIVDWDDTLPIPEGWEKVEENPYMTNLYSASSYVDTGVLSESIDNFYGVLIIAKYDTHNTIGSEFIPSDLAKNTNIIVRAFSFSDPTTPTGGRLIIGNDGKALQFIEFGGYITAIYGVFRK